MEGRSSAICLLGSHKQPSWLPYPARRAAASVARHPGGRPMPCCAKRERTRHGWRWDGSRAYTINRKRGCVAECTKREVLGREGEIRK